MMGDWDDGWMHGGGYGGWPMFFGMIILTIVVVLLVVYLTRQASGTAASTTGVGQATFAPLPAPAADSPRDIVKRRYATGEIDRETYLEILKDL